MDEYKEIEIDKIEWKDPIRPAIKESDIKAMSMSFLTHTQIQPIVVKPMDKLGKYEGVIGRLRYQGAVFGKRKTIEARMHNFRDESEVKSWQLAENLHRVDLSVVEKSDAWEALYGRIKKEVPEVKTNTPIITAMATSVHEMTGIEVAEKTIREYLRIASKLGKKAKNLLRGEKKFGLHSVKELLKIENEDHQAEIAKRAIGGKWTDGRVKKEVDDYLKVRKDATQKVKEALEKGGMTLQHAAEIAKVKPEYQDKLTDIAVHGRLKPTEVKKVAEYIETFPEEAPTLFQGTPEEIITIAEGKGEKYLDTETMVRCPVCDQSFLLVHISPYGRHELKEVV